ncbi:MAG: tRNA (cytidine(56)-2'-O)-methyltransferase [Candidatus Aenigmarchaeota archaeon]|nr:tRNA (cytidine(56)-2'-O)-methyltransferase [Candidatus Aenigmarchaeota archaeon]
MIVVLRLGHRIGRDSRISTHCGLVARALGADKIIYSGEEEKGLLDSIENVTKQWGGSFQTEYKKNWKTVINEHKKKGFLVVHLTVYGLAMQDVMPKVKNTTNMLIIVGGEKVPGEVYQLADYNIGVSQQPHSEIASLAVFLHEYFQGEELFKSFTNQKIKVIPQERGKKIVEDKS